MRHSAVGIKCKQLLLTSYQWECLDIAHTVLRVILTLFPINICKVELNPSVHHIVLDSLRLQLVSFHGCEREADCC